MKRYCYSCMKPFDGAEERCPHCGAVRSYSAPIHQLRPGTVLDGRYLVGKAIGQGGFGITYIGRDTVLDLRVAIKEYYPNGYSTRNHRVSDVVTITDDDRDGFFHNGKDKFLREAKILAMFCDDPGIVGVRDYFEANATAYIVMEYLQGVTLKDYITERGPLPAAGVLELMHPIITVLGKVHEHGVIHRDISPDNILLLADGRPKILDFGAAREVSEGQSLSVMLKLGYAPEEQYRRKGRQGPWTDVYALCATMYFCLTGFAPEESIERVWNNDENMVKPSEAGSDIDPREEAVLLKGLAVKSADRYQSMRELEAALFPDPAEQTLTQFSLEETLTRPAQTKEKRRRAESREEARGVLAAEEEKPPRARKAEAPERPARRSAAPEDEPRRERAPAWRGEAPRRKKKRFSFLPLLIVFAAAAMLFFAGMLLRETLLRPSGPAPTVQPTAAGQDQSLADVVFVQGEVSATPTITGLRLFLNGQELTAAQGLRLRAGASCTLSAQALSNTPGTTKQFNWSCTDTESLRLTPGNDTASCECAALHAASGLTLTLSCYGQVLTIPVTIEN